MEIKLVFYGELIDFWQKKDLPYAEHILTGETKRCCINVFQTSVAFDIETVIWFSLQTMPCFYMECYTWFKLVKIE